MTDNNYCSFQIINGNCLIYDAWPNETLKTSWGIVVLFIHFFIPVFILIFCYGNIVCMLSRRISTNDVHLQNQNPNNSTAMTVNSEKQVTDTHKDKFQLARRNTIKTLLIVGCFFFLCWVQCQIVYMMHNCGYEVDFNGTYYHYSILMVFLNCTVNPFIYLFQYRDYQIALKRFIAFRTRGKDKKQNQSSSSTSTKVFSVQ